MTSGGEESNPPATFKVSSGCRLPSSAEFWISDLTGTLGVNKPTSKTLFRRSGGLYCSPSPETLPVSCSAPHLPTRALWERQRLRSRNNRCWLSGAGKGFSHTIRIAQQSGSEHLIVLLDRGRRQLT